jgi:hypothetical protein
MSVWGAIAGGVGGLINAVVGSGQKRKGRKMLKQIGDNPNMNIPNEVLQNQKMAQLRANTGLPQEQYNQAMKNLQRNQMAALSGARDRRGGLSILAATQQNMDDGTLNLYVADAKARIGNENTLYGVNNNVANWKQKQWQNNVADKWNRKYQYAQSLLGAGNQNFSGGLNQLASAGISYLEGRQGGGGNKQAETKTMQADGTYGYQGYLDPSLKNRRTPNFSYN